VKGESFKPPAVIAKGDRESLKPPVVTAKRDRESLKPPVVAAKADKDKVEKPEKGESLKPPAVALSPKAESLKPPAVRESLKPSARGETPKPASVRGETPRPPGVKSAGVRSRRPPAVKEKEASPAEVRSKTRATPTPPRARKKTGDGDPLESHAQRFFAEGEAMSEGDERRTLLSEGHESDANALGSMAPPPHPQRRGALLRYVGIAVGLCAVLVLAALARIALARNHANEVPAPVAMAPTAAPLPEPVASVAPAPPAPVGVASAVPPPPVDVPPEPSAATPDVPTKSALEEKTDARHALERGKFADAIQAALRSTALDPTDADAWLLLGAAYQESGKGADARAAYATCAKEAKKGEVRECQLMLH
jgi:hypothetical protein